MGRPRSFDERSVLEAAGAAFTERGYEGTSVDDLLVATGLHRASLYQAFGSKRGLFLAVLRSHQDAGAPLDTGGERLADLLLVACLDLAPRDDEVRSVVADALQRYPSLQEAAASLGERLLRRALVAPAPIAERT